MQGVTRQLSITTGHKETNVTSIMCNFYFMVSLICSFRYTHQNSFMTSYFAIMLEILNTVSFTKYYLNTAVYYWCCCHFYWILSMNDFKKSGSLPSLFANTIPYIQVCNWFKGTSTVSVIHM